MCLRCVFNVCIIACTLGLFAHTYNVYMQAEQTHIQTMPYTHASTYAERVIQCHRHRPIHIQRHIHTHACINAYRQAGRHTYIHTKIHICIYIHTYRQTRVHAYIHTGIHAYMHMHIHIHIHRKRGIHTDTHEYHT